MSELPYDALLLVSFGGPEGPADVLPFLENVTRGRGIPVERLVEVSRHYHDLVGGVSPINGQNRALKAALGADFEGHGLDLPVYWGNRNWHPFLADALAGMRADGVRRALAFVTSGYASYSGCRQYREDIARAQVEVGAGAPEVYKLRHYFNHPGFVEPMADATRLALARLDPERRATAHLAFTAHSVPVTMARGSGPQGDGYVRQLTEAARLVAERQDGEHPWRLVFQSRSGPPTVPWLEPDINTHLQALHEAGATDVVVVPIGFVSDHMEVLYDLDTQAQDTAHRLGLRMERAATASTDPRFVAMVRDLVRERVPAPGRRCALGELGPSHDICPVGCCPPAARRPA